MSRRQARTLTEVELEFMQVIWRLGEATTDDVLTALAEQGRDLADGSIRKVLSILVQKGYLARRREGRGFVHTPTVEEAEANGSMVRDLLTRAFGGSAALMVASLLDSRDVRKKDVAAIKRLIRGREDKK